MINDFNKKIGARIRAQREYLGFTRESLCNFISISPQFLSEIESGIKCPSADMLYRLCEGLKISTDVVLMGKEIYLDTSRIVLPLLCLMRNIFLLQKNC